MEAGGCSDLGRAVMELGPGARGDDEVVLEAAALEAREWTWPSRQKDRRERGKRPGRGVDTIRSRDWSALCWSIARCRRGSCLELPPGGWFEGEAEGSAKWRK